MANGEGLRPGGEPCPWAGAVAPGRGFAGNMQNLRVWNYVLSPAEVGLGMVWPFERSRVRGLFRCCAAAAVCCWAAGCVV